MPGFFMSENGSPHDPTSSASKHNSHPERASPGSAALYFENAMIQQLERENKELQSAIRQKNETISHQHQMILGLEREKHDLLQSNQGLLHNINLKDEIILEKTDLIAGLQAQLRRIWQAGNPAIQDLLQKNGFIPTVPAGEDREILL